MLTIADFRGEINIPNDDTPAVCEVLCRFISQYEPQFLDIALGVTLASEFATAIAESTVPAPYDFLLNGGTYTDQRGFTRRWEGIKYAAARYVFWHWLRDLASTTTQSGVVVPVNENSERIGGVQKQVTAWNQMLDSVVRLRYLLANYNTDGALLFAPNGIQAYFRPTYQNTFGI